MFVMLTLTISDSKKSGAETFYISALLLKENVIYSSNTFGTMKICLTQG